MLLKAANDPKIPFEAIEKTVFKTLNARVALLDKNPFEDFVVTGEDRGKVCNFLKAFVKHGEDDSRYYGLVYKMLTHQSRKNKTFSLGFQMAECEGFDEVLNKLPQKMKTQEAFAGFEGMNDYSMFLLGGAPLKGQSLEDVKALLLAEIGKLKKGEFSDDLLPSVVANYKRDYYKQLESNEFRANQFVDAFINGEDWKTKTEKLDRISRYKPDRIPSGRL